MQKTQDCDRRLNGKRSVSFEKTARSVFQRSRNATYLLRRLKYATYWAPRRGALRIWSRLSRGTGKKVLTVFDPSLIAFAGHHMEYAQIIKKGCGPTYDVRFYANLRAATQVVLSLPAQPICEVGTYPPHGNFKDVYQMMTRSIVDSLNRIDRRDASSEVSLFMPTVSLYQLGGIAEWFLTLSSSERPKLYLQFVLPLQYGLSRDPVVLEQALNLARVAAAKLVSTGRTTFSADSKSLAANVSETLHQECAVLHLALRWPNIDRIRMPEPNVVFGFFGGLREEKGASLIARAVPEFAALHPDTKFIVHAPKTESSASAVEALESVPQVELIRYNFRRKSDYLNEFARASCILLPYDPVEYANRTSGVLIEALALDRLIITTRNTWGYSEAKRHGGKLVPISSFTSEALLSSLTEAHGLLCAQPIRPKINREVIAENSPEAFCRTLTQLVNG